MSIAHDSNHNLSSGGATYKCLPVAPPELVRTLVIESINIPRLWRSDQKMLIPFNFLFAQSSVN